MSDPSPISEEARTFRDALIAAVKPWERCDWVDEEDGSAQSSLRIKEDHEIADAVLAMAEMQVIRDGMLRMAHYIATKWQYPCDVGDVLDWYVHQDGDPYPHAVMRWLGWPQ
jgi:hypothetical protein